MKGLNSKFQQPILTKSDGLLNYTRAYLNASVLAKLLSGYMGFFSWPSSLSLGSAAERCMSSFEANQLEDTVVINSCYLLLSDFTNKALAFFCATKFDKQVASSAYSALGNICQGWAFLKNVSKIQNLERLTNKEREYYLMKNCTSICKKRINFLRTRLKDSNIPVGCSKML